jgi:3-carboxy-cis,cis-muconate cycloisomerase
MHAVQVIQKLEVDTARMRANLDATGGVLLAEPVAIALSRHLGAPNAYALVERACRYAMENKTTLRDVLEDEREVRDHLSVAELEELCDPATHLGMAEALAERALAEHLRVARERGTDT